MLGSVLGIVFAASSVYLAVKVGLTVSASIPMAVLSIAIFRALGRSNILENTIVQTVGSAGESLAFGVAAALPALLLLGYDIDLMHAFLVASLGGVLGVLMMIPLREGLIVHEHGKLTYPEGTAARGRARRGRGGRDERAHGGARLRGREASTSSPTRACTLFKEVVGTALGWVKTTAAGVAQRAGYAGGSVSMEVSPELLGVGYIIGPKVASITFAGGVLSYLILIPAHHLLRQRRSSSRCCGRTARSSGTWIRTRCGTRTCCTSARARWPRAASSASSARCPPSSAPSGAGWTPCWPRGARPAAPVLLRTEQDLPITVVLVGSALLVLAIWLAPPLQHQPRCRRCSSWCSASSS